MMMMMKNKMENERSRVERQKELLSSTNLSWIEASLLGGTHPFQTGQRFDRASNWMERARTVRLVAPIKELVWEKKKP